jgi:hypothetical protein
MSISSIPSIQATRIADIQARFQAHADLKTLKGDLQAGNLASAKTDFATLLKDAPQLQNQLANASSSPEGTALTALSSALQSGNLPSAQTAASSLQTALMRRDHSTASRLPSVQVTV